MGYNIFASSRTAGCGVNEIPLRYMAQRKKGGLGYTFLLDYLRSVYVSTNCLFARPTHSSLSILTRIFEQL